MLGFVVDSLLLDNLVFVAASSFIAIVAVVG
jgi:hypothetical protein